jgi:hypothetical protein
MNLLRGVFGCTRADQRNREIGESLNVLSLNKKKLQEWLVAASTMSKRLSNSVTL